MLFLDPDFIGKRYGSQILIELIETEDIKRIDVNSQNKYAKHFYFDGLFLGYELSRSNLCITFSNKVLILGSTYDTS